MRSLLMFAVLAGAPALAADGEALLAAAELPAKAKELRDVGVDAAQVEAALKAAQKAELTPADTASLFGSIAPAVKEHGPIEDYGATLGEMLEEGKRDADLQEALVGAHEGKEAAAPKPAAKPKPKPGPMTRPKPGGLTRPGSGKGGRTRPGSGGGGRKGGGLKRPGGR